MAHLTPNTILDGVREDLSMLVYDFVRTGKTDFPNFVSVWKANQFCYIYSGRVIVKEVKYFTREILILAKKHCLENNSLSERIAGVYIMYALYSVQPLKVPVRIRVEKDEFTSLLNFVKECPQKEVRYCFFQLFVNHAFDYVYSEKLYSLERIRERELEFKAQKPNVKKAKSTPKEQMETLWKSMGFDQQTWLQSESEYNELKSTLNMLGDDASFEMTEFLKPLLTIEENLKRIKTEDKNPAKPSSKPARRARSAFNVLEEESSSSEEDALGGDSSLPRISSKVSDVDNEDD